MKHSSSIMLAAAVLALGAVACFKDPTSSLRNGPSRILLTRSAVFLNVGDSLQVRAEVKDEQGNTFTTTDAAWTTSDAQVAVVNPVTTPVIPYDAFSRAFVRAVTAGKATVYFSSHGLTDSLMVVGVPLVFNGTITPATANVGDTITVSGTSVLGFSTAVGSESEITVGGMPVFIVSRTANAIKFISSPVDAGSTLEITNLVLLGSVKIASLESSATIAVGEANEPANDDPATPTAMTLYADKYGAVSASDVDDFYRFTTTTGDSIKVEVTWPGTHGDLDAYLLNATGGGYCALDACAMGTGANPEMRNVRLAAATTYQILVEYWDGGGDPEPIIYRIRTTKIQ